jgi:hypothetical protein
VGLLLFLAVVSCAECCPVSLVWLPQGRSGKAPIQYSVVVSRIKRMAPQAALQAAVVCAGLSAVFAGRPCGPGVTLFEVFCFRSWYLW